MNYYLLFRLLLPDQWFFHQTVPLLIAKAFGKNLLILYLFENCHCFVKNYFICSNNCWIYLHLPQVQMEFFSSLYFFYIQKPFILKTKISVTYNITVKPLFFFKNVNFFLRCKTTAYSHVTKPETINIEVLGFYSHWCSYKMYKKKKNIKQKKLKKG